MPAQVQSLPANNVAHQSNMTNTTFQDAGFDLSITDSVTNATGPGASPRLREVFANLTRHLHEFCRESKITRPEFHAALQMVSYNDRCTAVNLFG